MPRILIAGSGRLATAIQRELAARNASPAKVEPRGFEFDAGELGAAGALILAADDDAGNVDLALRARRMDAALPILVRLFDGALADYLARTVAGITVISMSAVAAPVFADAARKALAAAPAQPAKLAPVRRRGRFRVDPVLAGALGALFLLVFPSAAFFAHALDLRYLDALYFVWTTVMTVGYGDIALKDASDGAKLYGMALMLGGAAFIAVLFALFSDFVLARRLDVLRGRVAERGAGHVIIAGAGNIGFRVCGLLADSARRLVVIERSTPNRNAERLAASGLHVISADATSEDTLELAALRSAALVMALTDSDAVNLQLALQARAHGVPAIMRAESAELSSHVAARGDAVSYSPYAAAAAQFADTVLSAARRG